MEQTTIKNSGASFLSLRNAVNFSPAENNRDIKIGKASAKTAAQAITAIAYGDINNVGIPFRSLDTKTKCEDYADFAACISIIESYNDFDSRRILKAANWVLNKRHFLNEDNPNNGQSLFSFSIARESSPAFYVVFNQRFCGQVIKDYEKVESKETPGYTLYWEEYTENDFKAEMERLAAEIGADEFDIYEESKVYTARFWFD